QHFGSAPQTTDPPIPAPSPATPFSPMPAFEATATPAPIEQIHSASTELLTSQSLRELKKLMQVTFEEYEEIGGELKIARPVQQRALSRYESWHQGFLFKRLFTNAFAKRKTAAETESARVAELEEQLRLTTVATHIEIAK